LEASQEAKLFFQKSNRISIINYFNGASIKKNEVIASIFNDDEKSRLKSTELVFDKAKLELEVKKIEYNVADKKNSEIDKNILQQILHQSGYLEAENNLEIAKTAFKQTQIIAPFSGIIANLNQHIGDNANLSNEFCVLYSAKKMRVIFYLMQEEAHKVTLKQEVSIWSSFNNKKYFTGKVIEINPLVDSNSLVRIEAEFNEKTDLAIGSKVNVSINNSLGKLISIPKEALVKRSNKDVVFTYSKGYSKWNYIDIVAENDSSYAVSKGLSIGDSIIIKGNMNLAHDAKVYFNN